MEEGVKGTTTVGYVVGGSMLCHEESTSHQPCHPFDELMIDPQSFSTK